MPVRALSTTLPSTVSMSMAALMRRMAALRVETCARGASSSFVALSDESWFLPSKRRSCTSSVLRGHRGARPSPGVPFGGNCCSVPEVSGDPGQSSYGTSSRTNRRKVQTNFTDFAAWNRITWYNAQACPAFYVTHITDCAACRAGSDRDRRFRAFHARIVTWRAGP